MSCVPQRTQRRPLEQNSTVAVQGSRSATQLAPAMPQPRILPSRRIEPISGLRCSQPNFFAPTSKHSRKCREEKGMLLLSSFSASFSIRSCSGSIFSSSASSFMPDSSA